MKGLNTRKHLVFLPAEEMDHLEMDQEMLFGEVLLENGCFSFSV